MKIRELILVALVLLSSCINDGFVTENTSNDDVKITLLFEKDGVKMYRFYDGGVHYFTIPAGTTISLKDGKDETINSVNQ